MGNISIDAVISAIAAELGMLKDDLLGLNKELSTIMNEVKINDVE